MMEYRHAPRARLRLMRGLRGLNDHWIGDLIGGACLTGSVIIVVIAAGVMA